MKRTLVWVAMTVAIAGATFALGINVGDRDDGSDCSEWVLSALRDAKLEADALAKPDERYNLELTAFVSYVHDGVFFEGRDYSQTTKGRAIAAPHTMCTFDYSGSSAWKKYRSR